MKRTPLRRRAQLRARKPLRRTAPLQRTDSMAASEAQRAAVAGRPCIACGAEHGVDAAHLIPRSLGGCGDPLCVVPLCRRPCHRAYDSGGLDLLPYLEPAWRAQLAHAVGHVGLIGALRQISGSRTSCLAESEPVAAATGMIGTVTTRNSSTWTPEERAREERARTIRARRDRAKTPEDRLEETLRLSKLMSELRQGAARDVPGR
jgi:hypothetical protein